MKNLRTVNRLRELVTNLTTEVDGYNNENVLEVVKSLGPYEYEAIPTDASQREIRPMVLLENNTRYEGQWNVETDTRDGLGVLIWPDGSIYEG